LSKAIGAMPDKPAPITNLASLRAGQPDHLEQPMLIEVIAPG
jgi:hypothetical protein